MKIFSPVLTCMWGTCCQVPDCEVFPGPGRHFLRDVGTCWNIESDEPWRKVKVVIFFPWSFGWFFWDHHFPSRIRSEKHHIDFCKNEICNKSKLTKSQFQCNKRCSKIFEPLHTYNIDITTPPLIDKIGGLKSSTCTRSSPGPTCHEKNPYWSEIDQGEILCIYML